MFEWISDLFESIISSSAVQSVVDFFENIGDVAESIGDYPALMKDIWEFFPSEVKTLFFGIVAVSLACTIVHGLLRKV